MRLKNAYMDVSSKYTPWIAFKALLKDNLQRKILRETPPDFQGGYFGFHWLKFQVETLAISESEAFVCVEKSNAFGILFLCFKVIVSWTIFVVEYKQKLFLLYSFVLNYFSLLLPHKLKNNSKNNNDDYKK